MIAINTKTQEEYNELMKIYEDMWFLWKIWHKPSLINNFIDKNTCISYRFFFSFESKQYYEQEWYDIILFKTFKENIKTNPDYYDYD